MALNNQKTQELLWKYKEQFVLSDLGSTKQEGELELVLAIIDDSESALANQQNKWSLSKTKKFVNLLNGRIRIEENLVLILEIYNKLIKFQGLSFLKKSLTKLIVDKPSDLHSHSKSTLNEFEKALNLQEITVSILQNEKMLFIRNFLKDEFPLDQSIQMVGDSISALEEIEKTETDHDSQDFEELRDCQYLDLINLFSQLYLTPGYSETSIVEMNS